MPGGVCIRAVGWCCLLVLVVLCGGGGGATRGGGHTPRRALGVCLIHISRAAQKKRGRRRKEKGEKRELVG